jgi:putative flippase GtrA
MSFIQRTLRYSVVGLATAAIYYGLLLAGVEYLHVSAVLVSAIAFLVVISVNYLMHYRWTFATSSPHTIALKRYLFMTGCGFLINIFIMYFGVSVLHANYLLVQTIAMAVVIAWNYGMSSLWVFRV